MNLQTFHVKRPRLELRRLDKSLQILRDLNWARTHCPEKVAQLEAQLRQHDYDGRDKVDPRQLSIYETNSSVSSKNV